MTNYYKKGDLTIPFKCRFCGKPFIKRLLDRKKYCCAECRNNWYKQEYARKRKKLTA